MVTAPCKGCQQRHLGCHGTCEKYQEFRRIHDEEAAENRRRVDAYADMYSYKEEKMRRLK
jgi:hypothetical protein